MTMLRRDVRANERGTFAGLADANVIQYLQRLGITAIELLPVHAFVQDRVLVERGLKNYWGYNSICFFAIEPRYLSDRVARRDACSSAATARSRKMR